MYQHCQGPAFCFFFRAAERERKKKQKVRRAAERARRILDDADTLPCFMTKEPTKQAANPAELPSNFLLTRALGT
jgi:hypothetical protein